MRPFRLQRTYREIAWLSAVLGLELTTLSACSIRDAQDSWFFAFHPPKGSVISAEPSRALLFIYDDDFGGREMDVTANETISIRIPLYEYVVLEIEQHNIEITRAFHRRSFWGSSSATADVEPAMRKVPVETGEKEYIDQDFNRWTPRDGLRLERWKVPYAHVKLCDHDRRVCDDSPWQPTNNTGRVPPPIP